MNGPDTDRLHERAIQRDIKEQEEAEDRDYLMKVKAVLAHAEEQCGASVALTQERRLSLIAGYLAAKQIQLEYDLAAKQRELEAIEALVRRHEKETEQ